MIYIQPLLSYNNHKKIFYYRESTMNRDDIASKNIMLKAVIPLILLYGFKIGTIAEIKRNDFDVVRSNKYTIRG